MKKKIKAMEQQNELELLNKRTSQDSFQFKYERLLAEHELKISLAQSEVKAKMLPALMTAHNMGMNMGLGRTPEGAAIAANSGSPSAPATPVGNPFSALFAALD